MFSWREVVEFSQPLAVPAGSEGPNDAIIIHRPMVTLPVIVFDREAKSRRVVPMRWGFPHRHNPKRPDPIHARAETIDEKPTFKNAFVDGQRGIVIMRTFNEGMELPNGKTEQWTIDPGDGVPRGFAFLWRRFDLMGLPEPLVACVMVTVPASELISPITDRMPAILEPEDWTVWLGERPMPLDDVKATLKTMEDVNWKMAPEPKPAKPTKP